MTSEYYRQIIGRQLDNFCDKIHPEEITASHALADVVTASLNENNSAEDLKEIPDQLAEMAGRGAAIACLSAIILFRYTVIATPPASILFSKLHTALSLMNIQQQVTLLTSIEHVIDSVITE
jgi:hypothetical protein